MHLQPLSDDALEQRFQDVDAFLITHQYLWRAVPFMERKLPWETDHPELAAWLRARSLNEAEADHTDVMRLEAPAPFSAWAQHARTLASIGELPAARAREASARLSTDVPGRKWMQIQAFAQRAFFSRPVSHWVDWCAGKGHLGRFLAQDGAALTALEFDPALIAAGQSLSAHHGLHRAHHVLQDVLAPDAGRHLGPQSTPVALHACGELHVALLRQACATRSPSLAIAPCCYNRITDVLYTPLSKAGAASALQLDRRDLGLPLTETVTAGQRVRQQRDQSMARRLAFDALQRQVRGEDSYLPTPSLASHWLKVPLSEYCTHLADAKGIVLPRGIDWPVLEETGRRRLAEVRNLELVRGLFRRPLEVWLLLDRALYLRERGYNVELGTFCDVRVSPRNLMLVAELIE